MKASEFIKNECCGVGLLTIEKADLVARVENLEQDKASLVSALEFMIQRPFDESDFVSMVDQCNKILDKVSS